MTMADDPDDLRWSYRFEPVLKPEAADLAHLNFMGEIGWEVVQVEKRRRLFKRRLAANSLMPR